MSDDEHSCLRGIIDQAREFGGGEMRQVLYRDDGGQTPFLAIIVLEDDPEVITAKLKALDTVSERFDREDQLEASNSSGETNTDHPSTQANDD